MKKILYIVVFVIAASGSIGFLVACGKLDGNAVGEFAVISLGSQ